MPIPQGTVPAPEVVPSAPNASAVALVAAAAVLFAGVWVYRIDRSLPSDAGVDAGQGDPAVVSLVAEPFTTVDETYRTLAELERVFRARDDRRAVFLTVYARVTWEVAAGIDRGAFENPEWVAEYLVTFANYYRWAVLNFETGNVDALPRPWWLCFRTTETDDSLVLQCAVLGINAHVNYDLALALREVGIDGDRNAKYRDHHRINEILWRLVDETLDRLATTYAPGITTVAELTGPVGELLWCLALATGRESAWWIAVVLTDARWGLLRRCARWVMSHFSTVVALVVLGPNALTIAVRTLQRVETPPPTR